MIVKRSPTVIWNQSILSGLFLSQVRRKISPAMNPKRAPPKCAASLFYMEKGKNDVDVNLYWISFNRSLSLRGYASCMGDSVKQIQSSEGSNKEKKPKGCVDLPIHHFPPFLKRESSIKSIRHTRYSLFAIIERRSDQGMSP